jgi:hypothetical protein
LTRDVADFATENESSSNANRLNFMSKLVGLAAVDWAYRCQYMEEIELSGRHGVAGWKAELWNWDPEDEQTMPSGYALSNLRVHLHDLH